MDTTFMKKPSWIVLLILAGSILLQLDKLCIRAHAAAGDVDLSFDPGSGVNGFVWAVVAQPDGKVIIGGNFTTVKGLARTNLARLNADGSGDPTFDAGATNRNIRCLDLQPDGKLLVGGDIPSVLCDEWGCYDSYSAGVSRLNANGSWDNTFIPATGLDRMVDSIAVQSDGKVLVGGAFATINGTNRNGIARLNANGSLDNTFDPGSGATGYPGGVNSIVVQPDGKILIGGGFTLVNGIARTHIARLNANGSLDNTFNPDSPVGYGVKSVALQPDGKILLGSEFLTVNETNGSGIVRLNANGSRDTGFNPGKGANGQSPGIYTVRSIVLQPDGKVLMGGIFGTVDGTNRPGIARLNANGSLDLSFNPGTGVGGGYGANVALLSDGKVVLAANRVVRLNTDGSVDAGFDPGSSWYPLQSLALQPDGKLLLSQWGGVGAFVNGTNGYGSIRLNPDGSRDSAFVPTNIFNPVIGDLGFSFDQMGITALAAQPDGKVLVAALYYTYFNCDESGCSTLYSYSITRHHADGSRDASFEPAVRNSPVWEIEAVNAFGVQPDGKVVVGGNFFSIKGAPRTGLARLNPNGSLDTNFTSQVPLYSTVSSIVAQTNGKVMIAGGFASVNSVSRNRIARLNADGTLDSGFNPGTGITNSYGPPEIRSLVVQSDGKAIIGGEFTAVNGMSRNGIARLDLDGSLDVSFNPGTGVNGRVFDVALQADGKVVFAGDFTTVNGVVRPYVARLFGDSAAPPPSLNLVRSNASVILSWPVSASNFQLQESTNISLLNAWSPVGEPRVTNGAQVSVTVPTSGERRFFRLKSP